MRFYSDFKKILHITIPLLSSRLMNIITFFSGFVMVSHLGPKEFAASTLASTIFVTLIMINVGILYAVGIKISHAFGAENNQAIREYFYAGMLLAVILAVLATFILLFISFLLPYLGQEPQLIPYAKKFMYTMCLPMIPALLTVVATQLVTALLQPRIVFLSSALNVPVTISTLYLLIFGVPGIPALGIWGFGWAFLLSDIFQISVILVYVLMKRYFKQFHLWHLDNIRKNISQRLKEIIHLGFPMGIQFGAEIAAFSVGTFLIGRFGIAALNGYQIASQIVVVALMIPFTISEAAAILVGQALGRKDPIDIRSYGFSSVVLGLIVLTLVSVIFYTTPQLLISIYTNVRDTELTEIVQIGTLFLYVAAISQIFDGIRNVTTGALRGLHDSRYPMYIGIFVMWVIFLPLGMLFAFPFHIGPVGFQIAAIFAFATGAAILMIRFHQKSKVENIQYIKPLH